MDDLGKSSLVSRKLAHYRISTEIGAGGMGKVYRATDERLGRDVALKVLPPDMASDPDRLARFQREARAVAALNHPNVVTVYSVEQSDDVHFITMELIEGQPLDRLISADGLAAEQIIEIAGAVAEALSAAHEKGIVHRDLKPANVMVTNEGRVKVLDFGLAKDVGAETSNGATLTSAGRTQGGMVMGTPAYMSPEQVSGRPLDHRSDIFSFGVVLHEMATGRRPFEGDSSAELISSILRDTPPSVTEARPELPSDLARVIRRCLEKDPRYRVQTARDVSNEFRDLARTTTRPTFLSASTPRATVTPDSGTARADEGFWVAVLPFRYTGSNEELKPFTEGLMEEVITGLSRFSYLRVIARGSTAKYSSESGDVRAIGKELGARYVMEASIRQAGSRLRIAAQLIDAASGAHLWAETYDHNFQPDAIFDLQDELVPRIVSTVADTHGALPRSMMESVRGKDPEQLTPYEAVLRFLGYLYRVTPEEHAIVRSGLERAVARTPGFAPAWAMLSIVYREEYNHGFNTLPDPLGRASRAARRAIDASPSDHIGYHALASVLFFQREFDAFRSATQRAVTLNPMDSFMLGYLGMITAFSGDWEQGCAMSERARTLNPHHPGWYWFTPSFDAYRRNDLREALAITQKVNLPVFWRTQLAFTVIYARLGEFALARKAAQDLLAVRPAFATHARDELEKWWQPDFVARLMDDLKKAGLGVAEAPSASLPSSGALPVPTASGETRAAEGFWVAVLPFRYAGSSEDLKALAEGLSEEVITGLSRFSYLRVIARGSTAKYSSESGDVRAIGKELGARYVLEGSLRQAGNKLRLAVQLVDTVSGTHLWADTYERGFNPESIFELQDDLVPRIVSTVADQYGVLPRSISDVLRGRSEDCLTPHDALLRAFSYFGRITPEEHAVVRRILERAVREAPDQADCWAMLAQMYNVEFADEFNAQPNPLERALAAAQRAIDLAPTHSLGHYALAFVHFFRKEALPFRAAVERCMALNPMDGAVIGQLGLLMDHAGEGDQGGQMVETAMRLNPNYPPVLRFPAFLKAYRQGKYGEALEVAVRINMPGFFHAHAARTAALGQLGQHEAAQKALRDLLAVRPDFAATVRRDYEKWWDPEMAEQMMDGLRKAGLEIREDRKQTSSGSVLAAQSIAVLPFANLSADPEQDYFSDGLAEEIINLLAQIPELKVIARTSAFAFRGKEQDIRGIAEALGVSTVLEGSVRRSGSRVRVTAQLISATDGSHLWSERYDRELSDIFALQDEISAAIAKALRIKLSSGAPPQRYAPKLPAYEAYLKAKYQQAKVTPESMELARRFYEQASELDPGFAMAHVGLGFYWYNLAHFGRHFARDCVAPARAEAQRALQIDPSLPEAHALLGYITAMYDLDWAAAEKHFDSPLAKEVGFGLLRPLYAWVQFWQGNVESAIKLAQRAIEEDPLEVWARMNLHAYLQAAGRNDEALGQLKKVLELDENQVVALVSMAMIYADKGDLAEALKIARRTYAIGPWFPDAIGALAGLTRRSGGEIEPSLIKALGSGETPGDARAHALFHLLCGEIDEGADWAEKAIEQRDSSMMIYLRFVVSKGLRASHRWPKIAKMVNLPAI